MDATSGGNITNQLSALNAQDQQVQFAMLQFNHQIAQRQQYVAMAVGMDSKETSVVEKVATNVAKGGQDLKNMP